MLTSNEVRAVFSWGWTSYRKLAWAAQRNGRPLYGAHFRADTSAPLGWQTLYIQFYAKRPTMALRAIIESGLDPNTFSGTEIN